MMKRLVIVAGYLTLLCVDGSLRGDCLADTPHGTTPILSLDATQHRPMEVKMDRTRDRKPEVGQMADPSDTGAGRHAVPATHPRLFGSADRLRRLARERAEAYQRVVDVARQGQGDDYAQMVSMALVSLIEQDGPLARQAIQMALRTVDGPIQQGHVPFAHDLARCAIVYDLCHSDWSPDERTRFHQYLNETVDANVLSETHVFHNGWYGYKHWGIGLGCYATYGENPRAAAILRSLETEFRGARRRPSSWRATAAGGPKAIT